MKTLMSVWLSMVVFAFSGVVGANDEPLLQLAEESASVQEGTTANESTRATDHWTSCYPGSDMKKIKCVCDVLGPVGSINRNACVNGCNSEWITPYNLRCM